MMRRSRVAKRKIFISALVAIGGSTVAPRWPITLGLGPLKKG